MRNTGNYHQQQGNFPATMETEALETAGKVLLSKERVYVVSLIDAMSIITALKSQMTKVTCEQQYTRSVKLFSTAVIQLIPYHPSKRRRPQRVTSMTYDLG